MTLVLILNAYQLMRIEIDAFYGTEVITVFINYFPLVAKHHLLTDGLSLFG